MVLGPLFYTQFHPIINCTSTQLKTLRIIIFHRIIQIGLNQIALHTLLCLKVNAEGQSLFTVHLRQFGFFALQAARPWVMSR
jgi:hypothetical protein